jgi:tetratricopeptide (TPR) repeat protein
MTAPTPPNPEPQEELNRRLAGILQLIYKGDFAGAMAQAAPLREIPAAKPAATALQALAAAMAGDRNTSLKALSELRDPNALPGAEPLVAAGSAWFRLGEPAEAIRYLSAAVRKSPGHPVGRARLGACLLATGRIEEAVPHLEKAVELLPDSGGVLLNLAHARLLAGLPAEALSLLDRAEGRPDKDPAVYRATRTEALARLERHVEAEAFLREAAESGQEGAVGDLVFHLCSAGRHDEAGHALREALEVKQDDIKLLQLSAELAQVRGRFGEAGRFLDRALGVQPDNPGLWTRLAMLAGRRLGQKRGREAADKALELTEGKGGPARAMALTAHAQVLGEEGKTAESEAAYREALTIFPNGVPALSGLGHLLMQLGRVEDATALFEKVKKIAPLQGWSQLIHAREVPDDPAVLERMALASRRPSLEGPVKSHLLFTLASAWEKKKEYEKAWRFAVEANEAARKHLPYRPEDHRRRVDREIARFSMEFLRSRAGYGSDSRLPAFVLGMPRSGTTLVEQILGSHSQVFGAGELSLIPELIQNLSGWERKIGSRRGYPECVDDMGAEESRRFAEKHLEELRSYAPDARRIVDKLPHNFEHVGLIKLLFPNAKILHLKREPRDVAMSNYFVDYGAKFGGMGFAYDLSWIGEQLVDHQRLMDHWQAVFPGEILDVDYDLLVEDVEGWARRIIDYLELPWEEGVLSFQELERAVKTASVWQVRQPVYTTSKAKWKRYAAHLGPLEAALAVVPPTPGPMPLPLLPAGLFLAAMSDLREKRPKEAEASFRRLLTTHPSHAAARHFLGAALYQQGRLEEAGKEMRRSVKMVRGNLQWMENLLAVEQALGNPKEAEKLRESIERRKQGGSTAGAAPPVDEGAEGASE